MNPHLIRIVEGPLAGNAVAANDAAFDLPISRTHLISLTLAPAPVGNAIATDGTTNPVPSNTDEEYQLGGYAGI